MQPQNIFQYNKITDLNLKKVPIMTMIYPEYRSNGLEKKIPYTWLHMGVFSEHKKKFKVSKIISSHILNYYVYQVT